MLTVPFEKLDEAAVNDLVTTQASESETFDIKRQLPDSSAKGRDETLKDICAMANAKGGVIIYGIDEEDGVAIAVVPHTDGKADEAVRRIQQYRSAIEPSLTSFSVRNIPVRGGYVIAIDIPMSLSAPHSYLINTSRRFVTRTGTMTTDMSYDQLKQSFDRAGTLIEKAHSFIDKRIIDQGQRGFPKAMVGGVKLVVHVAPLSLSTTPDVVNVAGLVKDGKHYWAKNWHSVTSVPTLEGHLNYVTSGQPEIDRYLLLHRSGAVEIAESQPMHDRLQNTLHGIYVAQSARNDVGAALGVIREHIERGPAIVRIALLNVMHMHLAWDLNWGRRSDEPFLRHFMYPPATLIEDIASAKLDDIVRPLLDVIWQGFGVMRCFEYDDNGKWKHGD